MSQRVSHESHFAQSSSFFLRQCAEQLVHWLPWSEEVFSIAKEQDKPIFLSIGSAGCQSSQLMSEESFDDEDTARYLNEKFVCVKVDRDEYPQLTIVFNDVVQMMNAGRGGLSLSVFLTPSGIPFLGGSYFPYKAQFGTPAFMDVCQKAHSYFHEDKEELERSCKILVETFTKAAQQHSLRFLEGQLTESALNSDLILGLILKGLSDFEGRLEMSVDREHGGFGGAPKSLQLNDLNALMFCGDRKKSAAALFSLDKMRCAAITDQIDGGVFSSAQDARWMAPKFEKKLSDNVQLLSLYSFGSVFLQKSNQEKSSDFRATASEIYNYLEKNLKCPSTGLYFGSEFLPFGEENDCGFVFAFDDFVQLFGQDDALRDFAIAYFGVSRRGNLDGCNVLSRPASFKLFCTERNLSLQDGYKLLTESRRILCEYRAQRSPRYRDERCFLAGNALAASCLMRAGQALGDFEFLSRGLVQLDSIWKLFVSNEGIPAHFVGERGAEGIAFADDFAFWLQAHVDAYCATGAQIHAFRARQIVKWIHSYCVDPLQGTLFFCRSSANLFARPLSSLDESAPSPASSVYLSCRTYLSVCASMGVLSELDSSDVKMWEALELVSLATMVRGAQVSVRTASAGFSAARWASKRSVCQLDRAQPVQSSDWLKLSRSFWVECLADAGVWCVLSNSPAAKDASEVEFVADGGKPSDTPAESLALALWNEQGRYESTVNYADIIDQIRIHPEQIG